MEKNALHLLDIFVLNETKSIRTIPLQSAILDCTLRSPAVYAVVFRGGGGGGIVFHSSQSISVAPKKDYVGGYTKSSCRCKINKALSLKILTLTSRMALESNG